MPHRNWFSLAILVACWSLVSVGCDGDKAAPIQTLPSPPTSKGPDNIADLPPPTPAEREKALERLTGAIAAHGGAPQLAKFKNLICRAEGVLEMYGLDGQAEQELQLRFPDRFRFALTLATDAGKDVIVGAVRPSGAWLAAKGEQNEVRVPEQIDDLRNELYLLWVRTLLPLKNEDYVLRPLPVEILNKKPAEGIRVDRTGRPSIGLYFDSESHLLVRMVVPRWREAGSVQRRELDFHDHSQVDGLMLPTIQIDKRDGRQKAYWKQMTYRFPEKIDDSVFEKP